MSEEVVYVQCLHIAGIKATDGTGIKKTFAIRQLDKVSGRIVHSGYTPLTRAEYEDLAKNSKVFQYFKKLGQLVVHEKLPPEAQTPHEALVGARREVGQRDRKIKNLEDANAALKEQLGEANTKYADLLAAGGTDADLVKNKDAEITTLKKALEGKEAEVAELQKVLSDKDEEITTLQTLLDETGKAEPQKADEAGAKEFA